MEEKKRQEAVAPTMPNVFQENVQMTMSEVPNTAHMILPLVCMLVTPILRVAMLLTAQVLVQVQPRGRGASAPKEAGQQKAAVSLPTTDVPAVVKRNGTFCSVR